MKRKYQAKQIFEFQVIKLGIFGHKIKISLSQFRLSNSIERNERKKIRSLPIFHTYQLLTKGRKKEICRTTLQANLIDSFIRLMFRSLS